MQTRQTDGLVSVCLVFLIIIVKGKYLKYYLSFEISLLMVVVLFGV